MRQLTFAFSVLIAPTLVYADTSEGMIDDILTAHILPRFEALAETTQALSAVAEQDCDPTSADLRDAYGVAFDAWVSASHLRFGPTEVDDRAFALAFWPDSRGATPRALGTMIADEDPIAGSVDDYDQVSIAARGFYALEFLLYDDALMGAGDPAYHCQLVQTISADMAAVSQDILADWEPDYTDVMLTPSADGKYRSDEEVLQELLKALSAGLEFTGDTRLGRPLGTYDRPRPTRAEAYRSGRSAQNVMLSLASLQDLADLLAGDDVELAQSLDSGFGRAQSLLSDLNDPVFAGVSEPQSRLKVEVVQQSVSAIRTVVRDQLGPTLGVAAGFNALDGD